MSFATGVEPVVAGDQVVLLAQRLLELLLLRLVEAGILDHGVQIVVEIRVDQLQLRRAVLVEQRHRRPVSTDCWKS